MAISVPAISILEVPLLKSIVNVLTWSLLVISAKVAFLAVPL